MEVAGEQAGGGIAGDSAGELACRSRGKPGAREGGFGGGGCEALGFRRTRAPHGEGRGR